MDDIGHKQFLNAAASHRLLAATEERSLSRRVQAGITERPGESPLLTPDAKAARNELVMCNLRLVVSIARYYRNRGLDDADVFQHGVLGLNRAAEKYVVEKQTRFSTYATLWIRQSIQRGLAQGSTAIRLPSTVATVRAKARGILIRNPDADMQFIADCINESGNDDLTAEQVAAALGAAEVVTSLDREISTEESSHSLGESMTDRDADDNPHELVDDDYSRELRRALDRMVAEADEKEVTRARQRRTVVELNFGLTGKPPMSVSEIVDETGIARGTIKTRREEGIAYIREALAYLF